MPAWTCLPTGAKPPVSGSTAPILTVLCAAAEVEASAPSAKAMATLKHLAGMAISSFPGQVWRQSKHLLLRLTNSTSWGACQGLSPAARSSRMCLALRIHDLLEPPQHAHAGQHLREASVRLALFLNGGNELPVLQLDAVHGHVDLGHVDAVVLAVAKIVVESFVRAVIADVAEEGAERPVIIERKRQRQDGAGGHLRDNPHIHGDAERGMNRPLHRIAIGDDLPGLVLEQVYGMRGVVP